MNQSPWDRLFNALGEISYLIVVGGLGWKGSLSEHSTMSLLFAFAFAKFGNNLYKQNVAHSLYQGGGGPGGPGTGDSTRRMAAVDIPPAAQSPGRYGPGVKRVSEWLKEKVAPSKEGFIFTWVWLLASLFVLTLMVR